MYIVLQINDTIMVFPFAYWTIHVVIFLLSSADNVHLVFYEMVLTKCGFTWRLQGQKSRGGVEILDFALILTFLCVFPLAKWSQSYLP